MTEPLRAVFLSYASQDSEAARRLCASLRAAGIEVWFDQSELRGGDVWDQKIRQQIHDCTLFIPIISEHTEERSEGYFQPDWKLAVDRSHLMADDAAFLVPVNIDDTPRSSARVPEKIRTQWARLPAGEAPPAFCQRVSAALAGATLPAAAQTERAAHSARRSSGVLLWVGIAALVAGALGPHMRPVHNQAKAALISLHGPTRGPNTIELIKPKAAVNAEIFPADDGAARSNRAPHGYRRPAPLSTSELCIESLHPPVPIDDLPAKVVVRHRTHRRQRRPLECLCPAPKGTKVTTHINPHLTNRSGHDGAFLALIRNYSPPGDV